MRPAAAPATATAGAAQPLRYLTNDEAAEYLRLSPHTLEKQRVIGGGPKLRNFGRLHRFSLINEWKELADARGTPLGIELILPDWFYAGVRCLEAPAPGRHCGARDRRAVEGA